MQTAFYLSSLYPCQHIAYAEPDVLQSSYVVAFNAILKRLDISIVCQADVTLKIVSTGGNETYVALYANDLERH